jgi:hypothetical protein
MSPSSEDVEDAGAAEGEQMEVADGTGGREEAKMPIDDAEEFQDGDSAAMSQPL